MIYLFWLQSMLLLVGMILILKPLKKRLDRYVQRYTEMTQNKNEEITTLRFFLLPSYWLTFILLYLNLVKLLKTIILGVIIFPYSLTSLYIQDFIILIALLYLMEPLRKRMNNHVRDSIDEKRRSKQELKVMRRLYPTFYWFLFIILFAVIANFFIFIVFGSDYLQ